MCKQSYNNKKSQAKKGAKYKQRETKYDKRKQQQKDERKKHIEKYIDSGWF